MRVNLLVYKTMKLTENKAKCRLLIVCSFFRFGHKIVFVRVSVGISVLVDHDNVLYKMPCLSIHTYS
jgi:hypothetical protein